MTNGQRTGSLEARITDLLTADGSVVISPRFARWFEEHSGMTADRRIRLRDTDPDAYVTFAALHLAALGSECGTNDAAAQLDRTEWWSTKEAAKALGVTDRSIRKRCETGRLPAELVGGRWLIRRNTIALSDTA